MYHDIALSAFRYLGCHSFEEVDRMTMSEFELRMIKRKRQTKKENPFLKALKVFMIMKNELLKFWQLTSHNERN